MAYDLNGTSQYFTAPSAALDVALGTVSMWVRPDFPSNQAATYYQYFDSDTARHAYFQTNFADWIQQYNDGRVTDWDVSTPGWAAGQWVHLCFVHNRAADIQAMYVNGIAAGSRARTGAWGTSALGTSIFFGSRFSVANLVDGDMGEMAIFNVALTQVEITALAKRVSPLIVKRGLKGYWPAVRDLRPSAGPWPLTASGGPLVSDYLRIQQPSKRRIWVPVSAGGDPALTGNLATTSAGTPAPSLSLATTGNSATASQGTATPALSLAITGNAATSAVGTPVASISLALAGNGATASQGTVGVGGTTQALTGNAATASAGTPVASISLALSGNAATSGVGTATPGLSKAITGNAATASAGTVAVPGVIVPTSNVATASSGTVAPGITIALTGNGVTASVGTVSQAIALALAGLAGTSSAGIVVPGLSKALSGNAATSAAGSVGVPTGALTVALTGNAASASAGSVSVYDATSTFTVFSRTRIGATPARSTGTRLGGPSARNPTNRIGDFNP